MIKIDIISGFLGAGKTTLIKKLFESGFNNEKVVLIENEFGEIGIDGTFLKDSGIEIKEINSGCICCSLVGDFSQAMKELVDKYHPDRIIVEPSGVGKLSDIINAVKKVEEDLTLNILATVVDGSKAKMYLKNFGEFFIDQVDFANSIIVNKLDKLDNDKLLEVISIIKEKNPHANIITTALSELKGEKLLEILENNASLKDALLNELKEEHECCCHHHHNEVEHECCHHYEDEHEHHHHHEEGHECCHHHEGEHEHHHEEGHECCCHHHEGEHEHHHHHEENHECCCHHHEGEHEHHHEEDHECCCHHHEGEHHHHHQDADEVFTSCGIETPIAISRNELETFLNLLATKEDIGIVIRAKGILKASDNTSWYYFDYVSGDYEIRLGAPDYTGRLCVIGSKIDEEKINTLFNNRG